MCVCVCVCVCGYFMPFWCDRFIDVYLLIPFALPSMITLAWPDMLVHVSVGRGTRIPYCVCSFEHTFCIEPHSVYMQCITV